jgi:(p)ppGpp synthase/HD superfamily hydrolase
MVQEMQITMRQLLEAEQKARIMRTKIEDSSLKIDQEHPFETAKPVFGQIESPEFQALLAVCEKLENETPDNSRAVQIGRDIWRKEAQEANSLGFHKLKARLEDAALQLMEPDAYRILDDSIRNMRAAWQDWAEHYRDTLYSLLEEKSIPCSGVLFRVKHTAGVWAKMQSKGLTLDEIHDVLAFRIVVPTEADCYAALGVIHHSCKPIISRFKDYIARPKANGYRSLHTCIITDNGPIIEVQVRSVTMDHQAERGDAAHWLYKQNRRELHRTPVALRWWKRVRQMIGISVLRN